MQAKLIYHTKEGLEGGPSPFDRAIIQIAKGKDVMIACPYMSVEYVQWLVQRCKSWLIPHPGENEEDVPFWAVFWKMPSKALSQTDKRKWLEAASDELQRRKGS